MSLPDRPLVSVCMLTYQHSPFIAQALESVLCQRTDFPFEVILGEDASDDGTREICLDYAARYPNKIRLHLRSRDDVTYIDGRPTGRSNFIENLLDCRGEFIALLEGDDYWEDEGKLQAQVDFLRKNPRFGGMTSRVRVVDEEGTFHGTVLPAPKRTVVFGLSDFFADLRPISTCAFIFRRALLPKPFPKWFWKVLAGDLSISYFVMRKGHYIFMESTIRAAYRRHGGGIWTQLNAAEMHGAGFRYWEVFNSSEERVVWPMRLVNRLALARRRLLGERESSSFPGRIGARGGYSLLNFILRARFWVARNYRAMRLLK